MEIYLDNSATTRVCAQAVDAAVRTMTECYGNPSSLHRKGLQAEQAVRQARRQIAKAMGAAPEQVYFTSGATEANNLALIGGAEAMRRRGDHIIVSAVEHPSVLETANRLEQNGFAVTRLIPDQNGRITPQQLTEAMREDTILISVMLINNEVGLRFPIDRLVKAARRVRPEVLFHCDAVQGFCRIPVFAERWDLDLLTVSGHKVYAPKGVGALYLKKGRRVLPQLTGGGQEKGLRSGTENVPAIAGFGAAVEMLCGCQAELYRHYESLKSVLEQALEGDPRIVLHRYLDAIPYICSISAAGYRSEILLHALEQQNIYLSSGSACAGGKPSHVLKALGLSPADRDGTLRVSFGKDTTESDLNTFAAALKNALDTVAHS